MQPTLVAAAIIVRGGKVLITQRKPGTHLAGAWEFPGGKVEAGEDPRDGLVRELTEELGVAASVGDIVEVTYHRYPERAVLLLFYAAFLKPSSPEPRPLDIAAFQWAGLDDLDETLFPPADIAVLHKVRRLLAHC